MKIRFSNRIKACCCAALLCTVCAFAGCNDEDSSDASQAGDSSSEVTVSQATSTEKAEPSDKTPPVVKAADMEVFAGDSVSYKKNVIVTDNEDENPKIVVDSSKVDLQTPGKYPVVYTVTDKAGNKTELKITITVKKKPPVDMASVEKYNDKRAKEILAEITDSSMNTMQKAFAIYCWAKSSIIYIGDSDKSNYKVAAKEGFENMAGDCYTYYAVSKVLLEKIGGVQIYDMVKLRESSADSRHFWMLINIGSGWYHFDSTPYKDGYDYFFMVTQAELDAWDNKYRPGCHNYAKDGVPELSTKSVQKQLNYPERLPLEDPDDSSKEDSSKEDKSSKVTTTTKASTTAKTSKTSKVTKASVTSKVSKTSDTSKSSESSKDSSDSSDSDNGADSE